MQDPNRRYPGWLYTKTARGETQHHQPGTETFTDEPIIGRHLLDPYDTRHGHGPACWDVSLPGEPVRICGWPNHPERMPANA